MFYKLCTVILFYKLVKEYVNQQNIINMTYEVIYLYSKGQLWFNKNITPFISHVKEIIENILSRKESESKAIYYSKLEYYNNGMLVSANNDIIKDLNNFVKPDNIEYDLIIYSDYNKYKQSKCINKVCYNSFPDNLNYEVTDFKFLSLTVIFQEVSYNLDLFSENYNFYIVHNFINKDFLYYFMINIIKISNTISKEEFKYNLILIDHNVNVQNLDHTHEIVFLKDGYGIFCDKNSNVQFNNVYDDTNTNDTKDINNNENNENNNRKNSEEEFILT